MFSSSCRYSGRSGARSVAVPAPLRRREERDDHTHTHLIGESPVGIPREGYTDVVVASVGALQQVS